MRNKGIWLLGIAILFWMGCQPDNGKAGTTGKTNPPASNDLPVPQFNADSAYMYVEKQLAFGPRVPNTPSHTACGDWIIETLKQSGAEVFVQPAEVRELRRLTYLRIRNIIGSFRPEMKKRVMISAHWDTRPVADQDKERISEPIPGANDGASGVAVLLELARLLGENDPNVGVDLFFWDAEDFGNSDVRDSYCLGTQYWAKNLHQAGYTARYCINLDMVGARNARFPREGISMMFASGIVDKVWRTASDLGYGTYFSYDLDGEITDDHYYVNAIAGIPAIDIIDRPVGQVFFPEWHTHGDGLEVISKETLKAVGQTVLTVIFREP